MSPFLFPGGPAGESPPRRPSVGPWRSHDTDEGEWVVDIPNDGEITVTRLYFGDMETNTGRDISNADLVAAAPDLLEALEDALAWIRDEGGSEMGDETTERIEAAIAKALGQDTPGTDGRPTGEGAA